MDPKPAKPQHPSYLKHRSQVAWQIIVPVILAALVIVAAVVLLSIGTFRGNGDVDRWAAISTIWLVIPVMLGGILVLAILIAVAWGLGYLAGFIPPYSHKAQVFVSQVKAGVQRGAEYSRRPRLLIPEIGHLLGKGLRRLRGG